MIKTYKQRIEPFYEKIITAALFICLFVSAVCGTAVAKDTLIIADQYDATTMDPIGYSDVPSARACLAIYDNLIFIDDAGKITPGLATLWEFLSATQLKMNLRKGVRFHNGEEMKAVDVKYSLSRNLKEVKIIDDYTVIICLYEEDSALFSSC